MHELQTYTKYLLFITCHSHIIILTYHVLIVEQYTLSKYNLVTKLILKKKTLQLYRCFHCFCICQAFSAVLSSLTYFYNYIDFWLFLHMNLMFAMIFFFKLVSFFEWLCDETFGASYLHTEI